MITTKKKSLTMHKNLKGPRSPQIKPGNNVKVTSLSKSKSRGKKLSPSKEKPLKQLNSNQSRKNISPQKFKPNNSKKSSSKSLSKSKVKTSKNASRKKNIYVKD